MLKPLLVLLAAGVGACSAPLGADGPAPACPTPDCSACPGAPGSTPFVALGAAQSPTDVGAAQGVDVRDGFVYVFGDDDVGVIAELAMGAKGVAFETGTRARLTRDGADVIGHPTGLTNQPMVGTFMGNSLRNLEGRIYELDWEQLLITGALDNALLHEVLDDLSAAGSRPELVKTNDSWLVASADYTEGHSRVRLYDPVALRSAARTSDPGVLVTSFEAGGQSHSHSKPRARSRLDRRKARSRCLDCRGPGTGSLDLQS